MSYQISEGNPNAVFRLTDQNQAFANIAREAKSDLLLVGASFVGFLSTESHLIIQSLERGVKVRIVILDPNAESLLQHMSQAVEGNRGYAELKKDIEYSISQLDKISQLTSKLRGNLEVRITKFPLSITGIQVDSQYLNGALLIKLLAIDSTGVAGGPYFTINRRLSSDLFEQFSSYLETVWGNSVSLSPENMPDRT